MSRHSRALPADEREQRARRAALLSLDVAKIRRYARRWKLPLIDTSDDALLVSAHEARMRDTSLSQQARLYSVGYLAVRGDPLAIGVLREITAESDHEALVRLVTEINPQADPAALRGLLTGGAT